MKPNFLFVILALHAAAAPLSAAHYHVYLLGGQSNGNGRAHAAELTTPLDAPQTDIRFYWHRTQTVSNVGHLLEDQWIDLAPGSGHGTGEPVHAKEFGAEVSFGRAMADAKPSINIAIIKYTHGGTNLASNWSASGFQYTTFVSTVQAGLAALTSAGHTYELQGMLWVQGESDTSGSNADNYQANLTSLIARVRTDLFAGGALPFVIGSFSNSQYTNITTSGSGPYKVRQAQEAVAAADPAAGIVITDGYGVRSDVIHFNHLGQIALGQNFASQMLLLEGPDETGPMISSTSPANGTGVLVNANLVITFDTPVRKGSGGNIVIKQNGGSIFETIPLADPRISVSGSTVTIDPAGNFVLNTGYHVQISDIAIEDLAGNPWTGIADTTSWNFTTVSAGRNVGTTGIFDENVNATNQVDVEIPGGTLGAFKTAVLNAYSSNLGGVIDWETGVTATPSATTSPNNSVTSIAAAYGVGGSRTVVMTFDHSMDLYTNDINSQINALSQQGTFRNALVAGGANDPVGLQYTLTFSGAGIAELGAAMPSRSTYGASGVDFRATASFSGGSSALLDFTVGGTKGTGDTFLHFVAPGGQTITSLSVAYQNDNGQSLANGQRRPALDDLGFIVVPESPQGTIGTTGVFDENIDATNALDVELPGGTLGAFKSAVRSAYHNDLGGVIDWETGLTATPSAGGTSNNALSSVDVAYGVSGGSSITMTFGRAMELFTNNVNNQVHVLSQQGVLQNALIPEGVTAAALVYTITFSGPGIAELGAAMPSRSTYGSGVDFRATASYSGGGSGILDFTVSGTPGTSDTFLHFAAPGSETITSLTVAYVEDNGQSLSDGQRRPILDDLGFIMASSANTFAAWISDPLFDVDPADRGFGDDPDGDDLVNGVEAWFGTHPGQFNAGLANLTNHGTTTTFTHPRNANPPTDLSGSYQWSPDLTTWHAGDGVEGPPGGPTVIIVPDTVGPATTVTATANEALPRIFLRVEVSQL